MIFPQFTLFLFYERLLKRLKAKFKDMSNDFTGNFS